VTQCNVLLLSNGVDEIMHCGVGGHMHRLRGWSHSCLIVLLLHINSDMLALCDMTVISIGHG